MDPCNEICYVEKYPGAPQKKDLEVLELKEKKGGFPKKKNSKCSLGLTKGEGKGYFFFFLRRLHFQHLRVVFERRWRQLAFSGVLSTLST